MFNLTEPQRPTTDAEKLELFNTLLTQLKHKLLKPLKSLGIKQKSFFISIVVYSISVQIKMKYKNEGPTGASFENI